LKASVNDWMPSTFLVHQSPESSEQHGCVISTEDIGKEHCHLVGEWEMLLDTVRWLPHFKHFLRPMPFHELRKAATGGQVIIINISPYRVEALLFNAASQIKHVALPNVDVETLSKFANNILLHQPHMASDTHQQSYNNQYLKPTL
jgi:hypothetical protein